MMLPYLNVLSPPLARSGVEVGLCCDLRLTGALAQIIPAVNQQDHQGDSHLLQKPSAQSRPCF